MFSVNNLFVIPIFDGSTGSYGVLVVSCRSSKSIS